MYPMQHKIKMPTKPYVRSEATDIRKTIDAERKRLAALNRLHAVRVIQPIKQLEYSK